MTEKDLKKLKRDELLEMLIQQTERVEKLEGQLQKANQELESRKIKVDRAGSIAEAALQLNGIFEAAQASAEQYLENVRELESSTEARCSALESSTEEKCATLEAQTGQRCLYMKTETERRCADLEAETKQKCEKMTSDAEKESENYWADISRKLDEFYQMHEGLKEMLDMQIHMSGKPGKSE